MTKVLIVEDETGIRLGLIAQLQAIEWNEKPLQVLAARSMEEATDIIAQLNEQGETLPLAILDLMLPSASGVNTDAGFQLAQKLDSVYPDTAIIFLTMRSDRDAWKTAKELPNARFFITKPWNSEELRDAVLEYLQGNNQPIQKIGYVEEEE